MSETRVVRGEVVIPPLAAKATADLVVQIEDTSRADAPSVVVAEQRQRIDLDGEAVVDFEVEVPTDRIEARNDYSVRVHVDVSGSGHVDVGDLVSTRSYPVLTHGYGDRARVDVQKV